MQDADLHKKNLFMLAVDFSSAFNTIDQARLYYVMERIGVPQDAINVVKGIYTHATTQISCSAGRTVPIPVHRGTIQGDVLLPLLFVTALETLLRWLDIGGSGYRCGSTPVDDPLTAAAAAYADDLAIFADDLEEMKTQIFESSLIKKIEAYSEWMSMSLAPHKCYLTGILHHHAGATRKGHRENAAAETDEDAGKHENRHAAPGDAPNEAGRKRKAMRLVQAND